MLNGCTAMNTPSSRLLWTPGAERIQNSRMRLYMDWLARERGLAFADYQALWRWSVDDIEAFWASIADYFEIKFHRPCTRLLGRREMPGAQWFIDSELNFVDQILRHETGERPAIWFASETAALDSLSWAELRAQAGAVAAHLRRAGVKRGDRVAVYAPNAPETISTFLAVASLGAIWSVCAPEMGVRSILDRFAQIEPLVLIAVTSCQHAGKAVDKAEVVARLAAELPSIKAIVQLPSAGATPVSARQPVTRWQDIIDRPAELVVEPLPFDHPLWIVYSSGTTGLPKPIVHGHGGITLEFVRSIGLHLNAGVGDIFSWYTSTGWIMWNVQLAALAAGASIAIYDGSPSTPDWGTLWRFVSEAKVTIFGNGAAFFTNCMKADITPRAIADLSHLHTIGSTGSPLSEDGYEWLYRELGPDLWLTPLSGGTDFSGAFVGGCVLLPVYSGEMQCVFLGADIHAFDEQGEGLVDAVGELVCLQPLPSMPLYLWNDDDGSRYHDSYFDTWPGIWRHGDWIRITAEGRSVIYGRSDATINRFGVRLGTAEIYRAVEALPQVLDSLVVDLEFLGRDSYMPLFVVLPEGQTLDAALEDSIVQTIRKSVSARFVPNDIFQVEEVPRTLSGKKLEVPIKKILLGQAPDKVANRDTMANPDSLDWFIEFAGRAPKEDRQTE